MVSQDKALQCVDCGVQFTFSADEQEFFRSKGYTNEPKRCPACRETRRSQRATQDGSGFQPRRQMFPAVCAECGKDTEVPFQPRKDRPVYCSECYSKVRQQQGR
jgi:CxxC-x17-CxxC domain-containing protein